jgi:membrane protein DedA with SNARE-associated domain
MIDSLLSHGSYLGIIAVLVLTGMGLPVPEEVPIIAAGILSSTGDLEMWRAFASCLVGALLGDCMLYAIGYHFGHSLAKKHPRFAQLLHADREAQLEEMINRHGLKVFFLARFMVGVRAPVYLAAGVLRMKFRNFLLVDAICATSVVGLFFFLSHRFGEPILKLIRHSEVLLTVIVALATIGVVLYFWRRRRRRAAEQARDEGADDSSSPSADGENASRTRTVA